MSLLALYLYQLLNQHIWPLTNLCFSYHPQISLLNSFFLFHAIHNFCFIMGLLWNTVYYTFHPSELRSILQWLVPDPLTLSALPGFGVYVPTLTIECPFFIIGNFGTSLSMNATKRMNQKHRMPVLNSLTRPVGVSVRLSRNSIPSCWSLFVSSTWR